MLVSSFAVVAILVAVGLLAVAVGLPIGYSYVLERLRVRRRLQILDLAAHSHRGFESLVGRIFVAQGYRVVAKARGGPDGGVDLRLRAPEGGIVLVQCKNWLTWAVGVEPVRALYGVVSQAGASCGLFVISGLYSRAARQFARSTPADRPLRLVDGAELLQIVRSRRRLASNRHQADAERLMRVLERIDQFLPGDRLVDWVDAQFQHRPLWVPIAIGSLLGAVTYLAWRLPWLSVEVAGVVILAGLSARSWRWLQSRYLKQVNKEADLRSARMTRGRLQYLAQEVCQRQGCFCREFQPEGRDLFCFEAKLGKDRTLVRVHHTDCTRVTAAQVDDIEALRSRYGFSDAVIVASGVVTEDARKRAAGGSVLLLSGRELVDFLSRAR